jgi:hypothetical protein
MAVLASVFLSAFGLWRRGPAAAAAGRVAQFARPFEGRDYPPRKVRGLGLR